MKKKHAISLLDVNNINASAVLREKLYSLTQRLRQKCQFYSYYLICVILYQSLSRRSENRHPVCLLCTSNMAVGSYLLSDNTKLCWVLNTKFSSLKLEKIEK
jgi:hypothetical protein